MTSGYFELLGVRPALGGLYFDDDLHDTVVLSYELWQRRFAGEPGAVGSRLSLNGHDFTIVGVAERGFRGLQYSSRADVFVPVGAHHRAS